MAKNSRAETITRVGALIDVIQRECRPVGRTERRKHNDGVSQGLVMMAVIVGMATEDTGCDMALCESIATDVVELMDARILEYKQRRN